MRSAASRDFYASNRRASRYGFCGQRYMPWVIRFLTSRATASSRVANKTNEAGSGVATKVLDMATVATSIMGG
jgi:hypothetical protein